MSSGLVLAIDQGTTNTKALAFDVSGRLVASASTAMQVSYPQPGWAQQSPEHIWDSVTSVIATVVGRVGPEFDALAISNQRETIVVWDAVSGDPVAPAIIWQCRRTADACAALRQAGHGELVEATTGLALDPLFPATKIAWILDNVPGGREAAQEGRLRAGTIDSWLLWKLSGGSEHATDHSNASRTQLLNTDTLEWDEELGRLFNVPTSLMPKVRPSDSFFATIAAGATALKAGTPVHAMIGDSHAALYGHGIVRPGTVKATYGTGSSLMTLTDRRIRSRHGLSSTIAWSTADGVVHALEGNISVSGQAAAFMAEMLGLFDVAALSELAASVPDSNGVHFVPALVGLGAPHWAPDARGLVTGLALGTKRAHLARSAIEAIAYQVADVYFAMEQDLGHALTGLSVDGGPTRNGMLMQFQADIVGCPVRRGELAEVSAAGAAMLAAHGLGREMPSPSPAVKQFEAAMPSGLRRSLLASWHDSVARALLRQTSTNQLS